jgi:hypothetical protein
MSNVLCHRIPLRRNRTVEIELPRDLTKTEADKISAWLQLMVIPELETQTDTSPADPESR